MIPSKTPKVGDIYRLDPSVGPQTCRRCKLKFYPGGQLARVLGPCEGYRIGAACNVEMVKECQITERSTCNHLTGWWTQRLIPVTTHEIVYQLENEKTKSTG